jgi:pimeloyl-ACP methyl ester carboxylesterase
MKTVRSVDGTPIAFARVGNGPPLLLVHGGIGDHTRWGALQPYLEPHVTVYAMDRRGRGGSGDQPEWAVEREYEDVAAVVDAVARESGSPVAVYGHSGGGFCAFGAAALTSNIDRLVLYEGWPPVDVDAIAAPPEFVERMEALLAEGKREAVVETLLRDLLKMPEKELDAYRSDPSWEGRVAAAHTLPRELRGFRETRFNPQQAVHVSVPTLLLEGSDGPDWHAETVAAALPDARVALLDGQAHTADIVAPELVAEHVLPFLREHL